MLRLVGWTDRNLYPECQCRYGLTVKWSKGGLGTLSRRRILEEDEGRAWGEAVHEGISGRMSRRSYHT